MLTCFIVVVMTLMPALQSSAQGEDPILAGQVIARTFEDVDIQDVLDDYGLNTLDAISSRDTYLIEVPDGQENAFEALLGDDSRIKWAEANYEGNDPESRTGSFYVTSTEGHQQYQEQYTYDLLGLDNAHALSTGVGISIAVLDTGLDASHPELEDVVLPGGYNFVDDNADTSDIGNNEDDDGDGLTDESIGHGTFISGLIHMAAPDAALLPARILDSDGHGDVFLWAKGIYYAIDQGVDVINMSLGSTYDSLAIRDAVTEASSKGIVCVSAAGNRNSEVREYPSMYDDVVIGVAATDENDIKADFSSFNDKVAISAPGVELFSTVPGDDESEQYAVWDGTSLSTGLVAGSAALVMEANPDLPLSFVRFDAVRAALRNSAVDIDEENPQYDGLLGAGRLAADDAVVEPPVGAGISSWEVLFGVHLSGDVTDLIDDEDNEDGEANYLILRSRPGFFASEPNVTRLRVLFRTNEPAPSFQLAVTSRISTPTGVATLSMRNYQNGQLEEIHSDSIGQTETEVELGLSSATYISSVDGTAELRIKHVVAATFVASGFASLMNAVSLEFE